VLILYFTTVHEERRCHPGALTAAMPDECRTVLVQTLGKRKLHGKTAAFRLLGGQSCSDCWNRLRSAGQFGDFDWCFLIFAASSIPLIVTAAVSKRLKPSIGPIRCLTRRWSCYVD
jgi:hypothetical protein